MFPSLWAFLPFLYFPVLPPAYASPLMFSSARVADVLAMLRPYLNGDHFLDYKSEEKAFAVDVNESIVRQAADELIILGFTGEFYYGVTKIVFPHEKGIVIKVPIIDAFVDVVAEEVAFVKSVPDEYRGIFAATELMDEEWGIVYQERAVPNKGLYYCSPERGKIKTVIKALDLHDIHSDNVGWRRGTPRLIDVQSRMTMDRIKEFRY